MPRLVGLSFRFLIFVFRAACSATKAFRFTPISCRVFAVNFFFRGCQRRMRDRSFSSFTVNSSRCYFELQCCWMDHSLSLYSRSPMFSLLLDLLLLDSFFANFSNFSTSTDRFHGFLCSVFHRQHQFVDYKIIINKFLSPSKDFLLIYYLIFMLK